MRGAAGHQILPQFQPEIGDAARLGVAVHRIVQQAPRIRLLVADHELNASAFASRVAASTGASLAAAALDAGVKSLASSVVGGTPAPSPVGTGGTVNMSPTDHMGLDLTAFRMLEIRNGDWTLAQ